MALPREFTYLIKEGVETVIDFGKAGKIRCIPLESTTLRIKIVEEKK